MHMHIEYSGFRVIGTGTPRCVLDGVNINRLLEIVPSNL